MNAVRVRRRTRVRNGYPAGRPTWAWSFRGRRWRASRGSHGHVVTLGAPTPNPVSRSLPTGPPSGQVSTSLPLGPQIEPKYALTRGYTQTNPPGRRKRYFPALDQWPTASLTRYPHAFAKSGQNKLIHETHVDIGLDRSEAPTTRPPRARRQPAPNTHKH